MIGARGDGVRSACSCGWHIALLAIGTAFLLVNAFNGYIWFDESYSVGIANHSFADIWYIGSGDVHPVLYYWALHVLNLVFGQNILVYRLFTIAGVVATATLGLTHVRRDFGSRVGMLFSFLVFFTPYIAVIAVEIRMYTWALFAITLCAIYAWRITGVLRVRDAAARGSARYWYRADVQPTRSCAAAAARAAGKRTWAGVPRRWWVTCFAASLAGAYLHYFGVLAAFWVNALLLAFLLVRAVRLHGKGAHPGRALAVFFVGAALQVAVFTPWLAVLLSQLGVVSGTYWAKIVFPTTYIEWATYPIMTSFVSFASRGSYGPTWQTALTIIGWLSVAWFAALAIWAAVRKARTHCRPGQDGRHALFCHPERSGAAARSKDPRDPRTPHRAEGSPLPPAFPTPATLRSPFARFRRWLASDAVLPVLCGLGVYLGVFLIGWGASVAMGSLILYYRYLVVPLGPVLLGVAVLLSRVRCRTLVASACALLLAVAVVNQSLLVLDDYDDRNQVPLTAFEETVERVAAENGSEAPLITSTDIGYMSLTAIAYPDIPQVYMDWQKGNWDRAYLAYAPTMVSEKSWELILNDFHGTFIVLGQAQHGTWPRDIADLSKKPGITVRESHTYFRPYERTWLTIAILEKA